MLFSMEPTPHPHTQSAPRTHSKSTHAIVDVVVTKGAVVFYTSFVATTTQHLRGGWDQPIARQTAARGGGVEHQPTMDVSNTIYCFYGERVNVLFVLILHATHLALKTRYIALSFMKAVSVCVVSSCVEFIIYFNKIL